jgi:heat shock protein HslJ
MLKQLVNTILRKELLVIAVVISLIAVSVTLASAGKESPGLEGVQWTLVSIGADKVPDGVEITALFDESQVVGSAGCNSYFAGYEVGDGTLTISVMATTMMACSEPVMRLEMAFASAFQSAKSYEVSGERLEIVYEGGNLVFTAN